MSQIFVHFFQSYIAAHGAVAIFLVGILEDIFFFVPSSLVFMGAGFVMIDKGLGFWSAFAYTLALIGVPAAAGVTFGAFFVYGAVYKLGKPLVVQYGKYLGVTWEEIESVRQKFAKGYSDEVALFIMRALPVFPLALASILSGLVRLGWKEFVAISFWGVLVRATVSAMIGWKVGKTYVYYAEQFEVIEKYGVIVLLVLTVAFLIWHLRRHRKQ